MISDNTKFLKVAFNFKSYQSTGFLSFVNHCHFCYNIFFLFSALLDQIILYVVSVRHCHIGNFCENTCMIFDTQEVTGNTRRPHVFKKMVQFYNKSVAKAGLKFQTVAQVKD